MSKGDTKGDTEGKVLQLFSFSGIMQKRTLSIKKAGQLWISFKKSKKN